MSAQSNSNQPGAPAPTVSWRTRAGYIGTGVVIGLVIYPFVRKAIAKIQPKLDQALDQLTGRAENLAEKAGDLLAKAKDGLFKEEEKGNGHSHSHSHSDSESSLQ
jgi:hypothetical protein